MSNHKHTIASLPGAKRLDKTFADNLIRNMVEKAVPEVVRTVRDHQLLAADARLKTIKRAPKTP